MISNEKRVLRALVKLGGTATGDEIAQLLGPSWDGRRVGQVMSWLVPGRIEQLATGVYRTKSEYLVFASRCVTPSRD